jgi:putative N6-adenine-specific DNA methylase
VLWPLAHFPCADREALYKKAKAIDWLRYLTVDKTFAIDANVSHPNLRNSLFAALVVKDAICDQMRERKGKRPSINTSSPDVQLHLFIQNGYATISFDTSGDPLYKRGWRKQTVEAPLQESLAAALLSLAGFEQELSDPFCGSGTVLIEAAMMASKTPAGYFRKSWGMFQMPEFSEREWNEIKKHADSQRIPLEKGKIIGADKDPVACQITLEHLKQTGFDQSIQIDTKDIRSYFPSILPSFILSNPPYGKRLMASLDLYRSFGQFLQKRCAPSIRAYILSSDENLIAEMGLSIAERWPLQNGGIPVSLYSLKLK